MERKLKNNIKQELVDLNFNIGSEGIYYWLDAFDILTSMPLIYRMMEVYEKIGERRNKKISAIERDMRTALKPAIKNIQKKYKYYNKITNSTFLKLIRYKLL